MASKPTPITVDEDEGAVSPRRKPTLRWTGVCLIFIRVALAVFCLALILATGAYLYPQQVLTVDSGDVKGDILVVLGGGDKRAERAADLYRQGVAPQVLVTGHGDCDSNIQVLLKAGVPSDNIIPEPTAETTLQNASRSIPYLRQMRVHRAILVTSWYHSRRALACFRTLAPEITFYSRPSYYLYQPRSQHRMDFNPHVNEEYAKVIGYWLEYGVRPF